MGFKRTNFIFFSWSHHHWLDGSQSNYDRDNRDFYWKMPWGETYNVRAVDVRTLSLGSFSLGYFHCPYISWSLWSIILYKLINHVQRHLWSWRNLDVGHVSIIWNLKFDEMVTKGECHVTTTCSLCKCRMFVEVNNCLKPLVNLFTTQKLMYKKHSYGW